MMKVQFSPKQFFKLPLEPHTARLQLKTLNIFSEFRCPERPYLCIDVRKISFRNEMLSLGVKLNDEMEEQVFIRVTEKELLVSCTVDTDKTYLSRHAYYGLLEMMSIYDHYDFKQFYWPNFFDQKTGRSRYLNIINDRKGMDVTLKPKYPCFYKPGHQLIIPSLPEIFPDRSTPPVTESFIDNLNNHGLGYCLADTNLRSLHSNHFPFLVPYCGTLTKCRDSVKKYLAFLTPQTEMPCLSLTPAQQQLNDICFKMLELAPVKSIPCKATDKEAEQITNNNATREKALFKLWQSVIRLLYSQVHQSYYFTYGLSNVEGKPRKNDLRHSKFSLEIPKLCFLLADKGEYYQLEFRFKVHHKTLTPYDYNTAFFVNSKNDPMTFYLLGSFAEYEVTSFFARHKFKIGVLKAHYKGRFKDFVNQLGEFYELKNKS